MKTIAVLFGGRSCEHEVSVLTGLLASKLLDTEETRVLPVYVNTENELFDATGKAAKDFCELSARGMRPLTFCKGGFKTRWGKIAVDCAFNCCHGGLGEGGGLAALLSWYEIPSASPEMTESALFQDKYLTKLAVRSLGVPTADGFCMTEQAYRKRKLLACNLTESRFGYPVIVKPNRLGSSVGIALAKDGNELADALEAAFHYDDSALIEEYLPDKRDVNCAAYESDRLVLSECEEVLSGAGFLTYGEKYVEERHTVCPAEIGAECERTVRALTSRIYRRLRLRGVVRLDFILSGGKVYFNELNVVPGSLAYYLFSPSLQKAQEMLLSLAERAEVQKREIVVTGILKRPEILRANSCKIR